MDDDRKHPPVWTVFVGGLLVPFISFLLPFVIVTTWFYLDLRKAIKSDKELKAKKGD